MTETFLLNIHFAGQIMSFTAENSVPSSNKGFSKVNFTVFLTFVSEMMKFNFLRICL
jgi:hypothetical protein